MTEQAITIKGTEVQVGDTVRVTTVLVGEVTEVDDYQARIAAERGGFRSWSCSNHQVSDTTRRLGCWSTPNNKHSTRQATARTMTMSDEIEVARAVFAEADAAYKAAEAEHAAHDRTLQWHEPHWVMSDEAKALYAAKNQAGKNLGRAIVASGLFSGRGETWKAQTDTSAWDVISDARRGHIKALADAGYEGTVTLTVEPGEDADGWQSRECFDLAMTVDELRFMFKIQDQLGFEFYYPDDVRPTHE